MSKASKLSKELIVEIEKVADHTVVISVMEDLTIKEDIDDEVRKTSALFGYYAVLSELAASKLDKVKDRFEIWKASEQRSLIEENGGPFKTVAEMNSKLIFIPAYKGYKNVIRKYEKEARVLKVIAKAFEHKKDLVQTMAANRRTENE